MNGGRGESDGVAGECGGHGGVPADLRPARRRGDRLRGARPAARRHLAEELFATARAEGRLTQVDRECRAEALRAAAEAGLGAPFALFLNADAGALELDLPDLPKGGATLVMEITETALTERPEAVLRTLTELRTRGWGVSLDDVGADSRSLAVMPLLYPDVIKLDLRLLSERDPLDVARIVTAVGAEAERRHATILAEGSTPRRSSRWRAPRARRSARASCSASRRRCPTRCRRPGARCASAAQGAIRRAPCRSSA